MSKKKITLKKGDRVWVRLPMNAKIVRINKKIGYTLQTDDGIQWAYFGDDEVSKVKKIRHEPQWRITRR